VCVVLIFKYVYKMTWAQLMVEYGDLGSAYGWTQIY
jgi:hypothetical protein